MGWFRARLRSPGFAFLAMLGVLLQVQAVPPGGLARADVDARVAALQAFCGDVDRSRAPENGPAPHAAHHHCALCMGSGVAALPPPAPALPGAPGRLDAPPGADGTSRLPEVLRTAYLSRAPPIG